MNSKHSKPTWKATCCWFQSGNDLTAVNNPLWFREPPVSIATFQFLWNSSMIWFTVSTLSTWVHSSLGLNQIQISVLIISLTFFTLMIFIFYSRTSVYLVLFPVFWYSDVTQPPSEHAGMCDVCELLNLCFESLKCCLLLL